MRLTLLVLFLAALVGEGLFPSFAAMENEPAVAPPAPEQGQDTATLTTPKKVPPCGSTEMAGRLKSSFDSSDGAVSLHISAVSVRDAAEIDPLSLLATRLDRIAPPPADVNVAVYCKAHIELNTGHLVSQVFRIDVQPATGQETLMEAPIYDSDFDMRILSEKPAPEESPPGPNASQSPAAKPPMPPRSAPQKPLLSQRALPAGTVLCTLAGQLAPTSRGPGISCFRLGKPASFVVIASSNDNQLQVRLTGGDHAGVIAWTSASADGR